MPIIMKNLDFGLKVIDHTQLVDGDEVWFVGAGTTGACARKRVVRRTPSQIVLDPIGPGVPVRFNARTGAAIGAMFRTPISMAVVTEEEVAKARRHQKARWALYDAETKLSERLRPNRLDKLTEEQVEALSKAMDELMAKVLEVMA